MRKCLKGNLFLFSIAVQKKSCRFLHRHIESMLREMRRQRNGVIIIFDDFEGAAIVQLADHQLLSFAGQLVVRGGTGRFAATIHKEDVAAGT